MNSANDGLGGAVIAVLAKNGVAGKVPVTGQDATDEGLQRVLLGTQCMTVYKAIKKEADAAAALAIALAKGETPNVDRQRSRTPRPARTSRPCCSSRRASTPETVKDVVADGFTTAAKLCTTAELKAACQKYGVS